MHMLWVWVILSLFVSYKTAYAAGPHHGLLIPESALAGPVPRVFDPYKEVRGYFFWWRSLPTIGLEPHPDWSPVFYPFIPHYFSLQQLAPKQGTSVKIALIDNGVAHVTLATADGSIHIKAHPYLSQVLHAPAVSAAWSNYVDLISYYTDTPYQHRVALNFPHYTPTAYNAVHLTSYLIKYGKPHLKDGTQLSVAGKQAVQKLTAYFQHAMMVRTASTEQFVPIQLLGVPDYTCMQRPTRYADTPWLYANHGTFCAGLLGGHTQERSLGVASHAHIVSYKSSKSVTPDFHQDPLPVVQALQDVARNNIPIVSLSYSMKTSGGYQSILEDCFRKIPFSCVAIGNGYSIDATPNYLTSFPATLAVGSFGIVYSQHENSYTHPISYFTTRPADTKTWSIVLPGEAMLSCCYTPCAAEPRNFFVFMQGTSTSTPLLAGFLALMVAEFYPTLTYVQIKQLAQRATVRLHDTPAWRAHVTLDMRMALFMGHVLIACKKQDKNFTDHFTDYLAVTRAYLLDQINSYGRKHQLGIDFEHGMINFLQKARKQSHPFLYTQHSLAVMVHNTATHIMRLYREQTSVKGPYAHTKIH